ncbi:DUF4915 domain-containing protein [Priestia megaterium]|nr:DUF4915 domain-containing protein [Priestia megaterium]
MLIKIDDCQLLITCCNQEGGLYFADFKNGEHTLQKVLNVECRGIAKYQGSFVVASTNAILVLNEQFDVIQTKKLTERLDLHGVAVYGDCAYVVETKRNSIGIYDLQNNLNKVDEIKFSPKDEDVFHMNDLFIYGDTLYLSMFSYSTTNFSLFKFPKDLRTHGVIVEYSLANRKVMSIVHRKLFQPHSIKLYKGHLYYCVSAKFQVQKDEETIFNGLGYTRGLDIKDNLLFIGQSESRHIDRLLSQHSNILLDCGIYVHNTSTKISSFIHIPSKEIYQILLL